MAIDGKNIYADMLSDRLRTPIKKNSEAWALLSDIGLLVVDLSHRVGRIDEKVYGNGKTGMAEQVTNLAKSVEETHALVKALAPAMEKKFRETEHERKDSDWFRIVVRYAVDKILPTLLISAIVSYVAFQFAIFLASK